MRTVFLHTVKGTTILIKNGTITLNVANLYHIKRSRHEFRGTNFDIYQKKTGWFDERGHILGTIRFGTAQDSQHVYNNMYTII